MSSGLLLTIYCVAIAAISVAGGLLPDRVRLTHTRTQLVMSLVAGLMLGVACYHLLPHAIATAGEPHGVDMAVWWLMIGLIVMFLLLRMFHFHQHDFSADRDDHCDHHHVDANPVVNRLSWLGIALGLAVHTLIDGVALGAVMQSDEHGHIDLPGIGVFLAILLHKPLDAMSINALMNVGGASQIARRTVNLLFAAMCPLGAALFYLGVKLAGDGADYMVAVALAFSAGAFICIALSDLLPEVQFHSHDRGKLTLAFLLGIAIAYGIGGLEPMGLHGGID